MDPTLIAGIVSAGGSLVSLAAKFIDSPDPAVVLAQMRAELDRMQGYIGPGGALDKALAANNAALDAALEKVKHEAPNPMWLVDPDETTKP